MFIYRTMRSLHHTHHTFGDLMVYFAFIKLIARPHRKTNDHSYPWLIKAINYRLQVEGPTVLFSLLLKLSLELSANVINFMNFNQ